MPVNVNQKIAGLSSARRAKVEARAAELRAEEMTLRDLRKARNPTQVRYGRGPRHQSGCGVPTGKSVATC